MAFNGSGTYTLPAGNPVVTGTVISSTWANNTLSDIANNGLTLCLTKDGQQTPTANIPLGGFQLTGVGSATTRGAAPNAGQIQDGGLTTLGTVSGTDTITAASSPSITAYVAGQTFDFIATGANTTNTVTLNVSAVGAKAVMKAGPTGLVQLSPGDIQAGQPVRVRYDGTQFDVISLTAPTFSPLGTNKIVNGNFDLWLRGTSFTNAPNAAASYTADCWQVFRSSFVTGYTASQAGTLPANSQRAMLIQRTAGDTSTSPIFLAQSFETRDIIKWQGRMMTFSFLLLASGAFNGVTFVPAVTFGTGNDGSVAAGFTGVFGGVSTNVTSSAAFTQYTLTFTVPPTATQMGIVLSITPSSTPAGASDFFIVAQAQINEGSSARPFERRDIFYEDTKCRRYYNIIFPVLQSYGSAGQTAGHSLTYPTMRTAPTVTLVSPSLTNCTTPLAVNILGTNTLQIVATVTALGAFVLGNTAGVTLNASL